MSPSRTHRTLRVVASEPDDKSSCSSCRSKQYIWDEEVELVRSMNGVKQQAREAKTRGDQHQLATLRAQFDELRGRLEGLRRQRLDSLGWFDYD